MKSQGWMINIAMRRIEYVTADESRLNRPDYGRYRGPKRTYMLHDSQVFDTEKLAMQTLRERMARRFDLLTGQLQKYRTELASVTGALAKMENGE